jgi:hypothetical protein
MTGQAFHYTLADGVATISDAAANAPLEYTIKMRGEHSSKRAP